VIYPADEQTVFRQGKDAKFLPVVIHREEPYRNTGLFTLRSKQRGSDSLISDRHLDEVNGLSTTRSRPTGLRGRSARAGLTALVDY